MGSRKGSMYDLHGIEVVSGWFQPNRTLACWLETVSAWPNLGKY